MDLAYCDDAELLASSVAGAVERARRSERSERSDRPDRSDRPGRPDRSDRPGLRELWSILGELDLFRLGGLEGGGELVAAACEALGRIHCEGPLAATFLVAALLDDDDLERVEAGAAIVSLGRPPLLPFAPVADVFVELDEDAVFLCEPTGAPEAIDTLAREPWGRCDLVRRRPLGDDAHGTRGERAFALGDLVTAAYLVGAGDAVLAASAAHAGDRRQFGRSIGDFQAVAHPLVDSLLRLRAAGTLVRLAAAAWDRARPGSSEPVVGAESRLAAATARLSATEAALEVAYRAHQTFGAIGFTVEGPVASFSTTIRQVSLSPPGPDAARAVLEEQLKKGSVP